MTELLLIGFDSAWTRHNRGAIVAAHREKSDIWRVAGRPAPASFAEAHHLIGEWQKATGPTKTLIFIDQPTIVSNPSGQRPVEHIVSSAISLRFGGMQPASTGRADMFGPSAPIWPFLKAFGEITDPWCADCETVVLETYPALALIAFDWLLYDEHAKGRRTGRLPKYNPVRKPVTFRTDWEFVCTRVAGELRTRGIPELAYSADELRTKQKPSKADQDKLDALICLIVGLHFVSGDGCCVVGTTQDGFILAPKSDSLSIELQSRCTRTARDPASWIRYAGR